MVCSSTNASHDDDRSYRCCECRESDMSINYACRPHVCIDQHSAVLRFTSYHVRLAWIF